MDLKEFLGRVLPAKGTHYYGAVTAADGKLKQTKLTDLAALDRYITSNARHDTYFATGTYKNRRTAEDAEYRKAFYLDLDVGPYAHKFADKKAALKELVKFCKDRFLPPSLIVDSGGGLHVYWTLKEAIPPARWQPLANAFKDLHVEADFHADSAITADSARILRAPFTYNFKYDVPRPVRIIHEAQDYDLKDIEEKLNMPKPNLLLATALGTAAADITGVATYPTVNPLAKNMVKNCPMFAAMLETGGEGVSEPLWNDQLHALAFCEDGEDFVHEISRKHSGYSAPSTQLKWNQKKIASDRVGPTLCKTFHAKGSAQCATCPHFGSISTPLQLGTERDHKMPYPYDQDADGVFFYNRLTDVRTQVSEVERINVVDFNIEDFVAAWGGPGWDTIVQFSAVIKGKKHEVELSTGRDLHDKLTFTGVLSRCNVHINKYEQDHLRDLIVAWAKHIQRTNRVQRYTAQLGWTDNDKAFALADSIIYEDHHVKNQFNAVKNLASLYQTAGVREPWIEVAHLLTSQGRFEIDTAVLTAFAAPLMHFLSDNAALMAFVSRKSGSGKTTALQCAQAVWGNPLEAMNQFDDTQNAILKKMGYLHHLPAYWDEVRAKSDVQKFLGLILQLTGGKERGRMNRNTDLRETLTWDTILTVASNESIAAHANYASADTEAGRVRVFEVTVPPIPYAQDISAELHYKMRQVYRNYGVIGTEYAEYLVKNRAAVEAAIDKVYQSLYDKLLEDTSERFWLATVTALVVAGNLAKKLGYIKTDMAKYVPWLVSVFERQREDRQAEYVPDAIHAVDVLGEFIAEHRGQVIIYDRLTVRGRTNNGQVYLAPAGHGQVVAGVAKKEDKLRLSKSAFREWCYEKGYGDPRSVLEGLTVYETRGVIDESDRSVGRIRVYDIYNFDASDIS